MSELLKATPSAAAATSADGSWNPLMTTINEAERVPMNIDPAQATAYIINPLTGRKANFANLFTTHPPTAERIARLRGQV